MCGIIGFVDYPNSRRLAEKGLEKIAYRGSDSSKILHFGQITLGHNLHAIIDFVEQPLVSDKGLMVINCEIYNWLEIGKLNSIYANNDSELAAKYLDKLVLSGEEDFVKAVEQFDGDYAFAYYSKRLHKLFLARDIVGVKPIVYHFDEKTGRLAFASEKKALNVSEIDAVHLNPRKILVFDVEEKKVSFIDREIALKKVTKPLAEIKVALIESVKKRAPHKHFALLLSGGLDSCLLAKVFNDLKKKGRYSGFFSCISDPNSNFAEPKDLASARSAAKSLGLELFVRKVTLNELEHELPHIISLIESTDPIRVAVASTIYFATKEIHSHGIKIVFSGLGADELFAGYDRFKNSNDINGDCYSYFIKMYENDLYFEDIICMKNNLELRVPFLDAAFAKKALGLGAKYKIGKMGKTNMNKKILREIAIDIGLDKEIAMRPKKAAQYGSNFDKAIESLAKKHSFKSKADYLNSLVKKGASVTAEGMVTKGAQRNIPIAALLSTGKDSLYAIYLMQKQGYDVRCLITIESKNKDSFMFHTPTVELAKLQAKALGKRLVLVRTKGEKEKELKELEKGIMVAKKIFGIEGVCSGALFSNYQRQRIERVCEHLGVRHFAPLWHMNQEQYLRNLIPAGFKFLISKIACYGMDREWLGKRIDEEAIDGLVALGKKYGINVAGEGGEYETLITDMPLFRQKMRVSFSKKMSNEFTGEIDVKVAALERK